MVAEAGIERRRWPRLAASSLGMSGSIVAGPEAGLVDLSRGGALLDVAARLSLGSAVRVKLTQAGRELGVFPGRVAWQKVASIASGQINYRVAVAFEQPLPELPGAEPPRPQDPPHLAIVAGRDAHEPSPEPAVEQKQKAEAPRATDPGVDEIQKKLAAATADLACQTAILESLAGKLKESEQQRAALTQKAAEAVKKGGALFAALEARERKHAEALREQQEKHEAAVAQALREQHEKHEAIVAQLLQAANEQQAEYESLLLQQAAAKHHEAEREAANRRIRELEGRLEEAEMLCTIQQDRYRALRKETEKLMRMIDAASACGDELAESARVAS